MDVGVVLTSLPCYASHLIIIIVLYDHLHRPPASYYCYLLHDNGVCPKVSNGLEKTALEGSLWEAL